MHSGRVTPEQELAYLEQELDPLELAWAAGFFDGEGNVSMYTKKSPMQSIRRPYLVVQIGQGGSTEELERFVKAVGIEGATVLGPYGPYGKARLPVYRVMIVGNRARLVMDKLAPLLCSRKRADYQGALAKINAFKRR